MKNIQMDNNILFLIDNLTSSKKSADQKAEENNIKEGFMSLIEQQRSSFGKI